MTLHLYTCISPALSDLQSRDFQNHRWYLWVNSLWYIFLSSTCFKLSPWNGGGEQMCCSLNLSCYIQQKILHWAECGVFQSPQVVFVIYLRWSGLSNLVEASTHWFSLSQLQVTNYYLCSYLLVNHSWIRVKEVRINLNKQNQESERSWKSQTKGQGRGLFEVRISDTSKLGWGLSTKFGRKQLAAWKELLAVTGQ